MSAWVVIWLSASFAGEDESPRLILPVSLGGGRPVEPGGPQQLPDSGRYERHDTRCNSTAYPTDAKARENDRRKARNASGKEHVVNARDVKVEEHDDDCGA